MTRRTPAFPKLRQGAAAGLLMLLAACSSVSPPRFHSLMPAAASATPTIAPAGALAWEVLPVTVPARVDQPQWVVRSADGSLAVLEQERWIAPLGEEIRAAVADRLTQAFGAPATSGGQGKPWRVRIDVQRFDSSPAREARLEATWAVAASGATAPVLSCRGEFVKAVDAAGYPALAEAHRLSVAQLAESITRALAAISAGQAAACGR